MRTTLGLAVVVALGAAVIYQLRPTNRDRALDVLLPGESLNVRALDDHARQELSRQRSDGCFIAWIMDPHCPGCNQLAERQAQRVRDRRNFYWLFAGPTPAIETFVARYDLAPTQVLSLAPTTDVRRGLHRLGVTATPTRLVVRSKDLMVEEVRVMNKQLLEAPDSVDPTVCEVT